MGGRGGAGHCRTGGMEKRRRRYRSIATGAGHPASDTVDADPTATLGDAVALPARQTEHGGLAVGEFDIGVGAFDQPPSFSRGRIGVEIDAGDGEPEPGAGHQSGHPHRCSQSLALGVAGGREPVRDQHYIGLPDIHVTGAHTSRFVAAARPDAAAAAAQLPA